MEKERILVRDNRGFFLKMFKKKFKNEFDFFEKSLLYKNPNEDNEFNCSIFVVYNKHELVDFLRQEKKGANILVCLFNRQLYNSVLFLEEVKSVILLDCSKTGREIIKDLKVYFKIKSSCLPKRQKNVLTSNVFSMDFNDYCKALFLFT